MSRSIPANIITKFESGEITSFHLFKYEVNGTIYPITDCEVSIYSNADGTYRTYLSRGFSFDEISYSNGNIIDSCSLKIDNIDGVLTSIFVDNTIIDEPCELYLAIINDENNSITDEAGNLITDEAGVYITDDYKNKVLNTQQLFNGVLNDFSLDESELSITATSIFTKWDQNSNIKHSSLCRWKEFKGTECRYSGAQTKCDRTYARCIQLSNTSNFGGFRWLKNIEDLDIYWGPTPSQN